MSSSKIINQFGLALNEEQSKFLKDIKKKDNYNSIIDALDKLRKDKALVVGDLIIDNYIYGDVLGKSGNCFFKAMKSLAAAILAWVIESSALL